MITIYKTTTFCIRLSRVLFELVQRKINVSTNDRVQVLKGMKILQE